MAHKDVLLRRKIETLLGRRLRRIEIIHHIDHDHFNDDLMNLTLISVAEHNRLHKNAMYERLVKLVTVAQLLGRLAMLEIVDKILDVIESLIEKVDMNDPEAVDKLEAIAGRLDALAMDLKDRTESGK